MADDSRVVELERRLTALEKTNRTLIARIERDATTHAAPSSLLQQSMLLEQLVRERTASLEEMRTDLEGTNARLRDAKNAAEAAASAKSRFLANMSHEIRTPLNGIIGLLQLVTKSDISEASRPDLMTTLGSARSLLALLNDILDFSKFEAGKVDVEASSFDLAALTADVVTLFATPARERSVEVRVELGPIASPFVSTDPRLLRQALLNLVGNALKFTARGSVVIRLSVTRTDTGSEARVEVEDTGVGMSPETITRLFQPFTQGDAATTRVFGGTGLGLAITKNLVTSLGGSIGVESVDGKGSRFWFTIPVALASRLQAEPHAVIDSTPLNARVLVAEDNPINQLVTRRSLERLGCEVVCVTDGVQAVAAALASEFDVVLMDCQMPVLDGFAATRAIRAQGQTSVPIVALTANALSGDREACFAAGMDDYLSKPVRLEDLATTLRRVLARDGGRERHA